jgi:hypothetical protein
MQVLDPIEFKLKKWRQRSVRSPKDRGGLASSAIMHARPERLAGIEPCRSIATGPGHLHRSTWRPIVTRSTKSLKSGSNLRVTSLD